MKTGMAVVMLLATISLITVAQETASVTLSGYVVDQHCAGGMASKANAMQKAAGHTRDCALMEMCAASGFGIFSGGKYFKFDAKGSEKAKGLLEKSKLSKGMYFTAVGKIVEGSLQVTSLAESAPVKPAEGSKYPN